MILENHIDALVGALLLDRKLRETILQDRVAAVHQYNTGYARRYEQRKVELTDEEAHLLSSAEVRNLNQLFEFLAAAISTKATRGVSDTLLPSTYTYEEARTEIMPARLGKIPASSSAA